MLMPLLQDMVQHYICYLNIRSNQYIYLYQNNLFTYLSGYKVRIIHLLARIILLRYLSRFKVKLLHLLVRIIFSRIYLDQGQIASIIHNNNSLPIYLDSRPNTRIVSIINNCILIQIQGHTLELLDVQTNPYLSHTQMLKHTNITYKLLTVNQLSLSEYKCIYVIMDYKFTQKYKFKDTTRAFGFN